MRDDALPALRVAFAGVAILALVGAAIATVLALLHHRHLPPGGVPVAVPADVPTSQPALQTAPQQDLVAYRRTQAAALASADATHVPITQAMAALASACTPRCPPAGSGLESCLQRHPQEAMQSPCEIRDPTPHQPPPRPESTR